MSISLKDIIQDLYKHRVWKFGDVQTASVAEEAGKILATLYEYHKNGSLAPESIIFLKTTNSIEHIISILLKLTSKDLDTAIHEESHKLNRDTSASHKRITLISIIELVISEFGGIGELSESVKENFLRIVSDSILDARIYGDLDEDTRKLINQPDHELLLSQLYDDIVSNGDVFESIRNLYRNILSREHDFLDEVARDKDIEDVVSKIDGTEKFLAESLNSIKSHLVEYIKMHLVHQFGEVHKHLDHVGNHLHGIIKEDEDFYEPEPVHQNMRQQSLSAERRSQPSEQLNATRVIRNIANGPQQRGGHQNVRSVLNNGGI